jgi:hypothetical protein
MTSGKICFSSSLVIMLAVTCSAQLQFVEVDNWQPDCKRIKVDEKKLKNILKFTQWKFNFFLDLNNFEKTLFFKIFEELSLKFLILI